MKIRVEVYPNEYLRLMRGRLELTQSELAQRLGIARGSLTRYEIGESPIPAVTIRAIEHMADEVLP